MSYVSLSKKNTEIFLLPVCVYLNIRCFLPCFLDWIHTQCCISINLPLYMDFRSIYAQLLMWLKSSLCPSVQMFKWFIVSCVHLHLNYIYFYTMCLQPSHPELMRMSGGFVCASFAVASAGAGCGSDSTRLNIQQAKFVHKKPCVSVITHSARQSQIVADKINTANRYE